ncbi:MAG: hypothetical protein ACK47M_03275 [Caldilinea sp.]
MHTPRLCLAESEQAHLRKYWRSAFDAHWSGADSLLARISPPNWTLEWSLPGWLGDAMGLSTDNIREVTIGNLFGLAYVRLHDDLSDERFIDEERAEALALATRLYQRWLAVYIRLFGDSAQFWGHFERYLDQWLLASLESDRLPAAPFEHYDETHFLALGHRGALIKVCAAATCLLAGREELLPRLEHCLDQLMIGAVLLDHAADWQEDMAAMRPNVFVASMSPLPQIEAHASANRAAVLRELSIGRGARSYFAVIDSRLSTAQSTAENAGIAALANDCAWLRHHAASYRRGVAAAARRRLSEITVELLGASANLQP